MEKLRAERVDLRAELKEHTKAECTGYAKSEPVLNFLLYKGKPLLLLWELWNAPKRMLSYQQIREDVMCKDEASIDAVMGFVKRAKNAMKSKKEHYEIENIHEWGYRLLYRESCQNLSKTSKTPRTRRKNDRI
jgi:hypothetical protein